MNEKEKNSIRCKLYYYNNREKINKRHREYNKKYYNDNKDIIMKKEIQKRLNDPNKNELHKLRSRLNKLLIGKQKSKNMLKILGCENIEQFKNHFEKQFKNGMNWDNYGNKYGWQVDHIKPCKEYNLTNANEVLECFNINNLRPVWPKENIDNIRNYNLDKIKNIFINPDNDFYLITNKTCGHCKKIIKIKIEKENLNSIYFIKCYNCNNILKINCNLNFFNYG